MWIVIDRLLLQRYKLFRLLKYTTRYHHIDSVVCSSFDVIFITLAHFEIFLCILALNMFDQFSSDVDISSLLILFDNIIDDTRDLFHSFLVSSYADLKKTLFPFYTLSWWMLSLWIAQNFTEISLSRAKRALLHRTFFILEIIWPVAYTFLLIEI